MNDFLTQSIDVIVFLQQYRSIFLDMFFKIITVLGNVNFFIVILPLLFWCYDSKKSFYLTFIFLINMAINTSLKYFFQVPRPFLISGFENINLIEQDGFALPSAHAQASIVFYGILSTWFNKKFKYILLIILPFLIGLSRIYLGVHYPTDVILGWVTGLVVLLLYIINQNKISAMVNNFSFIFKSLFIIIITVILIFLNLNDILIPASFLGTCLGYNITYHYFEFDISNKYLNRFLAYIIGVSGVLVIYVLLKIIFPQTGSSYYVIFRFIRYALLGFWVTALAPLIFVKTGLYKRKE